MLLVSGHCRTCDTLGRAAGVRANLGLACGDGSFGFSLVVAPNGSLRVGAAGVEFVMSW